MNNLNNHKSDKDITNIIVNIQYEAVHCWEDCNIKQVEYLKNKHRHIFHIKAKKTIYLDRQEEIIIFKNNIINYLDKKYNNDFKNMSCEKIAQDLVLMFNLYSCEVLEDGENGAEYIK